MPLGYESFARIKRNALIPGGALTETILCTSASNPLSVVRLESSSAYGGTLNDPTTRGIGRPHTYGYPLYEGSVNCDLNAKLLSMFLKPWVTSYRQLPFEIYTSARSGGYQYFTESYWRKVRFSTAAGSQVACQVEYISPVELYQSGGAQYFDNIYGVLPEFVPPITAPFTDPPIPPMLNPSAFNSNDPVPFWNTYVEFDGTKVDGLIDWHLDFQQDVSFFFTCENSAIPIQPSYYAVGIMGVTLGGNAVLSSYTAQTPSTSINVVMGQDGGIANGNRFLMTKPELNQRVDPIVGVTSTPIHSFEYSIYELSSN